MLGPLKVGPLNVISAIQGNLAKLCQTFGNIETSMLIFRVCTRSKNDQKKSR